MFRSGFIICEFQSGGIYQVEQHYFTVGPKPQLPISSTWPGHDDVWMREILIEAIEDAQQECREMNVATVLRCAEAPDADAIARVQAASWQETYAGLLPASTLSAETIEDKVARWKRILGDRADFGTIAVYIAENDGHACGFASGCQQRTDILKKEGFAGEISAIYVLRRFQRGGTGTALLRTVASSLLEQGIAAASLWCLKSNCVARRFYERLGGEIIAEDANAHGQATLVEIAYGWRDLASLAFALSPS